MVSSTQRLVAFGAAVALVSLSIAAAASSLAEPAVVASPAPVGGPRVAEQTELTVPGTIVSPSPDGRLLAGAIDEGPITLCVYTVAALDEPPVCLDRQAAGITSVDLRHVAWSPDSTRLAFTEEALIRLDESDVWVMDAATGQATNLTDDGLSGNPLTLLDAALTIEHDVFPVWSPDGSEIVFARGITGPEDREETWLMRVPAGGGAAVAVRQISADDQFSVPGPPAFTPDGARLLYTVGHRQSDDPENGVWILDRDGGDVRHLAGTSDPERGYPILQAVSPRGDLALAVGFEAQRSFLRAAPLVLIDLETGAATPLVRLDPTAPDRAFPYTAAFSPDGSMLLMAASGGPDVDDLSLLVRDLDGGVEHEVLTVPTVNLGNTPGLWWLSGGVVLFDSSVSGEGESDPDVWTRLRLEPAGAATDAGDGGVDTPTPDTSTTPIDPTTVVAGTTLIVNDAVAAVRSAPNPNAPVVAELRQGAEVIALGPAESGGGYTWIPIRDPATGTIGYVRAELLSLA